MRQRYIGLLLFVASIACTNNATTPTTTPTTTTTTTTATPTTITPSTFTITWNSTSFPSTPVGTTSTTTVVATLWNTGTSPVAIGSVTDSNVTEFPWTTTCPLNATLAAASSCTTTASFKPASLGAKTASFIINANGKDELLSLTGTGVQAVNPQLSIAPSTGSTATLFALTLSGATPGGQVTLNTKYTPAPGQMDIPFAPTVWTADSSGQLTVTSTHDSPGTFENWFVDQTTNLSSNHVVSVVQ